MSASWEEIKLGLMNDKSAEESPETTEVDQDEIIEPETTVQDRSSSIQQLIVFATTSTVCFAITFYLLTADATQDPQTVAPISPTPVAQSSDIIPASPVATTPPVHAGVPVE